MLPAVHEANTVLYGSLLFRAYSDKPCIAKKIPPSIPHHIPPLTIPFIILDNDFVRTSALNFAIWIWVLYSGGTGKSLVWRSMAHSCRPPNKTPDVVKMSRLWPHSMNFLGGGLILIN